MPPKALKVLKKMENSSYKLLEPVQCKLWNKGYLNDDEIRHWSFKPLREFIDESHMTRSLLKCDECGQLYFYEFYEVMNFDGGDDDIFYKYIPVESEKIAEEMSKMSPLALAIYTPQLQINFPPPKNKSQRGSNLISVGWIK